MESHKNISISDTGEENEIAWSAAKILKVRAYEQVQLYLETPEFKDYVDALKRRERKRMLEDIESEILKEKYLLLNIERERLRRSVSEELSAEKAMWENRKKIEEQQRKSLEEKQKRDTERLLEVTKKAQLEAENNMKIQEVLIDNNKEILPKSELERPPSKLSFPISKKKGLF